MKTLVTILTLLALIQCDKNNSSLANKGKSIVNPQNSIIPKDGTIVNIHKSDIPMAPKNWEKKGDLFNFKSPSKYKFKVIKKKSQLGFSSLFSSKKYVVSLSRNNKGLTFLLKAIQREMSESESDKILYKVEVNGITKYYYPHYAIDRRKYHLIFFENKKGQLFSAHVSSNKIQFSDEDEVIAKQILFSVKLE